MDGPYEPGGQERVLARALALCGMTEAPEHGAALLQCAADTALALCARRDIPRGMENGVAALLAELLRDQGDRPISSVRRGDTAITYGSMGPRDARLLLQPYVRLRTPRREGPR